MAGASEEWEVLDVERPETTSETARDPEPETGAPAEAAGLQLEARVEWPCVPVAETACGAVLSVLAPASVMQRAPICLTAVLDKSGSMSGQKLHLVVASMRCLLQHLTAGDELGLVVYDTKVSVLARLTKCDAAGKAELDRLLRRVAPGSATNLSGGMLAGLALHKPAPRGAAVRFGNTYFPVESDTNPHGWALELRGDVSAVARVVYTLHPTFQDPVVEVTEAPFRLQRQGWGTFRVAAAVHLKDGSVVALEHELSFASPETFREIMLPVAEAGPTPAAAGVVRSTFLFTDGLANHGITEPAALAAAARAALQDLAAAGCSSTLHTFGFGADHNAELLRALAEAGEGSYSFIEKEDGITDAFAEALGGLLTMTHQAAELTVALAPGVELLPRTAFAAHPVATATGTAWTIALGDFFAEERRDVVCELRLPAGTPGDAVVATASLRAFSLAAAAFQELPPLPLRCHRAAIANPEGPADLDVAQHRARFLATDAMDRARALGEQGNVRSARETLQEALRTIEASGAAGVGRTPVVLAGLRECINDLQDQQSYQVAGSKKMAMMSAMHSKQRACGHDNSYSNSMQVSMKAAFKSAS